jgi:hypothetical protein
MTEKVQSAVLTLFNLVLGVDAGDGTARLSKERLMAALALIGLVTGYLNERCGFGIDVGTAETVVLATGLIAAAVSWGRRRQGAK